MKKFSVYANCQSIALAKTLLDDPAFSACYELIEINPVHTLSAGDVEGVKRLASELDLFIYQPFGGRGVSALSSSKVLTYLSDSCVSFSFPPLYFDGYFPQLEMFQEVKSPLNLVHDFFIMKFFLEGASSHDCEKIISDDSLISEKNSKKYFAESIWRLENREKLQNIDFPVSNFIRDNALSYKLFNQFNHPRKPVFQYLKTKIFERLGLAGADAEIDWEGPGYLDGIRCPVLPCMEKNLGVKFLNEKSYFSQGRLYTLSDVIKESYKFYRKENRSLLEMAIQEKKSQVISLLDR